MREDIMSHNEIRETTGNTHAGSTKRAAKRPPLGGARLPERRRLASPIVCFERCPSAPAGHCHAT
jgi:hypothetical protein